MAKDIAGQDNRHFRIAIDQSSRELATDFEAVHCFQQKGAAMYRSSVRKFIQGVLSLLDEGRDLSFEQIAELSEYTIADILAKLRVDKAQEIRDGMPAADWDEIMSYIGRFSTAHGPQSLHFYDSTIENSFLCWLAAIGVEMLSDV